MGASYSSAVVMGACLSKVADIGFDQDPEGKGDKDSLLQSQVNELGNAFRKIDLSPSESKPFPPKLTPQTVPAPSKVRIAKASKDPERRARARDERQAHLDKTRARRADKPGWARVRYPKTQIQHNSNISPLKV